MADKRSRTTLTDRPLSVYDNLTATVQTNTNQNNHNNNNNSNYHNRQEPTAIYSFPDISFKFDDEDVSRSHQPITIGPQNPSHQNHAGSIRHMEDPSNNIASRVPSNNVVASQPVNDQHLPEMYTMMMTSQPQPHASTHIRYDFDDHHQHHPHHHHQQQNYLNHQPPQQQQQQTHNYNHPNHNDYATITKPIAQYENVAETIKLRNSFRAAKPVISDAKSSFFGLDTTTNNHHHHQPTMATHALASSQPPAHQSHHYQDRAFVANVDQQHDRAPLILGVPSVPPAAKSNGEYQNIPSNSAFFHHNNHRIPGPATIESTPPAQTSSTWNPASATSNNVSPSGSNMSTRSVSDASQSPNPPKSSTTNNDDDQVDGVDGDGSGCQLGVVDDLDHHYQNKRMSEHNPSQVSFLFIHIFVYQIYSSYSKYICLMNIERF